MYLYNGVDVPDGPTKGVVHPKLSTIMYKELYPFNLIDLDALCVSIPDVPSKINKRCIVFINEPIEIKSKCKIVIIPFCCCKLNLVDIEEIEHQLLMYASKKEIEVTETNAYHIVKEIKRDLWHGFAVV